MANVTVWTSKTRYRGQKAPRRITGINWSSPLAAKIVMALPLVGNVAQRYFSARGEGFLNVVDATRSHVVSAGAMGWNFDGAGSDAIDDGGVFAHQSGATSISAWMRSTDVSTTRGVFENSGNATDATANYAGLFITHGFAGTTNPSLPHAWQGNSSGTGSGNRGTRAAGTTVGANVTALVAATTKTGSTFPDFYLNGQLSNGSTSGGGSAGGPRSGGYVRAGNIFNGINTNADPYAGSVWNCAIFQPELSVEDHAWLYRAPWDMYKQSTRTYFLPGPNSGLTGPNSPVVWTSKTRYRGPKPPRRVTGINWSSPLAYKLVSGGLVVDGVPRDLVAGTNLSYYGNAASATTGELGPALAFNASSRNVETLLLSHLGNTFLNGSTSFTMGVVWKYTGTADSSDEDALIGQWSNLQDTPDSNAARALCRYASATNTLVFAIQTTSGSPNASSTVSIEDGRYHWLAFRYDGANLTTWCDGRIVATTAHTSAIISLSHSKVPELMGCHQVTGNTATGTDSPRGDLKSWFIADRAWSDAQMHAWYAPQTRWDAFATQSRTYFIPSGKSASPVVTWRG